MTLNENAGVPVLHVGFHKCGSTTLQGALFARHPGIAYLGEPKENPRVLAAVSNVWKSCCVDSAKRKPFNPELSRELLAAGDC